MYMISSTYFSAIRSNFTNIFNIQLQYLESTILYNLSKNVAIRKMQAYQTDHLNTREASVATLTLPSFSSFMSSLLLKVSKKNLQTHQIHQGLTFLHQLNNVAQFQKIRTNI